MGFESIAATHVFLYAIAHVRLGHEACIIDTPLILPSRNS